MYLAALRCKGAKFTQITTSNGELYKSNLTSNSESRIFACFRIHHNLSTLHIKFNLLDKSNLVKNSDSLIINFVSLETINTR